MNIGKNWLQKRVIVYQFISLVGLEGSIITSQIKLEKFFRIYKMVTLKDLETYIKVKDYIGNNDVTIEDLLRSLAIGLCQ